jgi:hypothetical protein
MKSDQLQELLMRLDEKPASPEQCCILLPKAKLERFPHVFAHLTTPSLRNKVENAAEIALDLEQWSILLPKQKIESFPEAFGHFLFKLRTEFGGYSYDREVSGSWLERTSGVVHNDENLIILVGIPRLTSSRDVLRNLVSRAASDIREMSIFASVSGGATFFVWAMLPRPGRARA